jgi:transposase
MEPGTTERPADYREYRRLQAWKLKQQGWKQKVIAEALGVTEGAVSQWLKRGRAGGVAALRRRVAVGPTLRLSTEQRARLPELLERGTEAFGFEGNVWTTKRIATVIRREFGVRYHPAHVSRLVRGLGLSVQKPAVRATQRDEAAIERWRAERWPRLKKSSGRRVDDRLGGRGSLLPTARRGAHLCPTRPDTHPAGQADA